MEANFPASRDRSKKKSPHDEKLIRNAGVIWRALLLFFAEMCVGTVFRIPPPPSSSAFGHTCRFSSILVSPPQKFMLENGDDGAEETHYVAGSSPDAFSFFRVFLSKSDASAVSKSHSGSVAAGACEQNREETGEKPRGASKEKTNKMCTKKITRQRGTLKTVTMNVKSARQTRKNSSVTTLPRNFTSVAPLRSVSLEPPGGGGGGR